jgi:hypothetical protein
MADPALTQVVNALATQITVTNGPGVFVDRDDAEPIDGSERPAKVIRVTDVVLDERMETGLTAQLHIATIDIDHYVDTDTSDNLTFQHNADLADTVALIGADDTLGGKVFELVMVSVTANADNVPDSGVAILTLQVKFQTHLYDWTVLVPIH